MSEPAGAPTRGGADGCPVCGAARRPGARFCPGCGAPQARRCAACGEPLPAGDRFCASCGAPAEETPAGRPVAHEAGSVAQAERRVSSVLFGDLVGFTTLAETRDPEEVRELLSGYFDRCREVVARYGGTIEKFIGDAVMAVWGVPVAHEDDAERAVRAALDLVDEVAAFGERLGTDRLALRVGVVTGEVAVTLGAVNQGMVAGDAVNTAARVQAKAEPGSVWADDLTRALTSAAIAYEPAGVHELKGKAEPVSLYRATAVMGTIGGEGRDRGVEAPLVGRRRELGLLKDVFQAAVEDRRGRLLVVAGAPGVGKSRLGWELQKFSDGLSATVYWHWGRCAAYGDGVAYSALSAAVRRRIGADDDAAAGEQRERLRAYLGEVVPDADERSWLEPRLAVLLGGEDSYPHEDLFAAWLTWFERVSRGGTPVIWVIDDAHHADDGLLDFVEHLVATARIPLLVVLLARQELLDRRPRLAVSRRATVMSLEGLAEGPMEELFDALVVDLPPRVRAALVEGSEGVPLYAVETVRAMLDRGLVVVEDGRRHLAPGVDAARLADIGAPTSLQVLIASRLDALPARLRELAQYASVLGTAFSLEGLAAVSGWDRQEVATGVEELAARDLVQRVADRFSPDFGRYAFVQAMVRQVAYRTQSRQARLNRHLAAARHLETQAESAGELVAAVALHLSDARALMPASDPRSAELDDDLVRWLERSGQRAVSLGAPDEALTFYTQALEHVRDDEVRARLTVLAARAALDAGHLDRVLAVVSGIQEPDPLELRAEVAVLRGDALRRLGRPAEAQKEFQPYLEVVDGLPDATAVSLLRLSSRAHAEMGDAAAGRPLAEEALRRAERAGDPVLIGWALNDASAYFYFAGLPRLGVSVLDTAVAFCDAHHVTAPLVPILVNRALGSVRYDVREALQFYRRGLERSRSTGEAWAVLLITHSVLVTSTIAGAWADDETADVAWLMEPVLEELPIYRYLNESLMALRAWVRGGEPDAPLAPIDDSVLAEAPRDMGQEVAVIRLAYARESGTLATLAAELAERAVIEQDEYGGTTEWFPFLWSTSVQWLLESGTPDDLAAARDSVARVMAFAGTHSPAVAAQLPRLRAAVALADPHTEVDGATVERDLREAIDALEAYGALPDRARAQLMLGRWLAGQGRAADARPLLAAARATFDELGMTVPEESSWTP